MFSRSIGGRVAERFRLLYRKYLILYSIVYQGEMKKRYATCFYLIISDAKNRKEKYLIRSLRGNPG